MKITPVDGMDLQELETLAIMIRLIPWEGEFIPHFMMMAQEENIPAVMFNQDPNQDQGMNDETIMANMQEGNPEAFAHLQDQVAMAEAGPPEEQMPEGFLAGPPEGEFMEPEEQPMIEGEGMI